MENIIVTSFPRCNSITQFSLLRFMRLSVGEACQFCLSKFKRREKKNSPDNLHIFPYEYVF